MFAYARAMKTINFQLSSQKCIDEGYVIRAPSPLLDQEVVANPFEIEPLEWYTSAGDATEESEEVSQDEDGAFHYDKNRPPPRKQCVERYYPDEAKFLTMFPDGTGNVFYPNGQLAISVSSVSPGQFTYLVYNTQTEEGQPQQLLAEFEPDAVATCYHRSGNIRLFLDQLGGLECHPNGSRKRRWHWLDQSTHAHAPPVQPLCFALNKYIGIRVLNQDNISMTFLSYQRSCRFNVGVKLKLIHPENIPIGEQFEEDSIYMKEKANHVSGLLDKIENLLKYPHSSRAQKIQLPKRVTIQAERIEKQKTRVKLAKAQEKMRKTKKYTRPLPPIEQNDIDPVLITETGEVVASHRGGGRQSKHPVIEVLQVEYSVLQII
ncbi:ERICH6 [Bugula neritina]|uniref:ERICH6 n=1 Tax=Bugula neritina TaxID=10212 RepID=A0A7J7KFX9_BUGNE|nr:ERICH6 [Bugula neritina]